MRKVFGLLVLVLLVIVSSVSAQDDSEVVVDGLNNPRALYFDDAGTLYIAEAGTGGTTEATGAFGPVLVGDTSRVWTLEQNADAPTELISGLLSMEYFQSFVGAADVAVTEDTVWVLLAQGPADVVDTRHSGLVGYDRETLEETAFVDLAAFETENNPDNDDVATNPNDLAVAPDGTVYIVDASGNDLLSWTEADGLQLVHAWEELPVPTSVAVDAEGSVYVSFLSAFPFPAGGARIEKWTDGELAQTFEGLSAVTDVIVGSDGNLYAVQMSSGMGDAGWTPDSGSVVSIAPDGTITEIASGLNFPYDIAEDWNGVMYVTVNAAYSEADSGQVITLAPME